MVSMLIKIIKSASLLVRKTDLFGKEVFIAFKETNKFKTRVGGWTTILVILFLIFYGIYLLQDMFRRQTIVFSTNTVINDLTSAGEDHRPAEAGFAIAFGFRFSRNSLLDEEMLKHFKVKAYQYTAIGNSNGTFTETWDELELIKWNDAFPYANQTLVKNFYINNYVCLKNNNYNLTGNWYSDKNKNLFIEIFRCDTGERDDWYDKDESDSIMFNYYFDLVMIDSYFDLDSFDKPVKSFLTQKYFYTLEGGKLKGRQFFIKENIIERFDDYSSVDGNKKDRFYSVKDDLPDEYDNDSDQYAYFKFSIDAETQVYKRNVYTILDVISQVGGIFSLLTSFCTLVVGLYAERMLYYTALSNCYTFENQKSIHQELESEENKEAEPQVQENSEEVKVPNEFEGGDDEEHSVALSNGNIAKKPKQF